MTLSREFLFLARLLSPVAKAVPVPEGLDWDLLLELAERHRVSPALAEATGRHGIDVPARHRARLAQSLRQAAFDELALAASARSICERFAEAGVPLALLKGVPLSYSIHGRLGLRVSRDIDLLVAPGDVAAALPVLAALGFRARDEAAIAGPRALARLMRRCKDIELINPGRQQIVELHWRLFDNSALLPLPAPLPLETVVLPVDWTCPVLSTSLNLRYLALHGAQHGWSRLKWLADFAALVARLDTDAQAALCRETRIADGRRALRQAFLLCETLFGMAPPPSLPRADRRTGWLVAAALRCMAADGARELESVRFGSTVKNLAHYLLSASPAYLLAELGHDLSDLSDAPPDSPFRRFGPVGRLGAWLTHHGSLTRTR